MSEFNKILNEIFHENNIGQLFTVDIKFGNINEKTLLCNELHPLIFKKK